MGFLSFLSPLYTAVSWVIVQFHSFYGLIFDPDGGWAWGLSIVSLVVIIRICLIPLFVKQIKASRAMSALQPQMKELQKRYKNDRQKQAEEMQKLYKEAGTNPFSSCLPIIVQAPFFYSLYEVLRHVAQDHSIGFVKGDILASAQHATIFGAHFSDKFVGGDTGTKILTAIMIVMMSASQFITQRQLMTKNVDLTVKTPYMRQQKMLMYGYPVFFMFFGANFQVGVLLYWLTTNVWTMGQQLVVIRRNPTPGSKAYEERQARLKAKGKLPSSAKAAEGGAGAAGAGDHGADAPRRQQPKRTTKAQRRSGHPGGQQPKVSTTKSADGAEAAGRADVPGQGAQGPASGGQRKQQPTAKSGGGQRKQPTRNSRHATAGKRTTTQQQGSRAQNARSQGTKSQGGKPQGGKPQGGKPQSANSQAANSQSRRAGNRKNAGQPGKNGQSSGRAATARQGGGKSR